MTFRSKNSATQFLLLIIVSFLIFAFKKSNQEFIPIWFKDYNVKITGISQLGDTINFHKSPEEKFRFVFYDRKGRCYCERYIKGKLFEKGFFTTHEDPSKVLVSARNSHGETKPIRTEEYFEPIKNGEWHIYEEGKEIKSENYSMGILQK